MKSSTVSMALTGGILFFISIGSLYSLKLISYSFWLMLVAVLIPLSFIDQVLLQRFKKKPLSLFSLVLGGIAGVFLALFLGMQTPQIPYKITILVLGLVLTLPALFDVFKQRLKG